MPTIHCIDVGLALTAALINSAFVLLILTRTSLAEVYISFLLNCLTAVIWTYGDFMVLVTGDRFWFYFSLIGTGMVPAVMFHFISALAGRTDTKRWIATGYILCFPLALSSPVALRHSGIRAFVDGRSWNVLFLILFFSSFLASVFILKAAIREARSKSDRSRV
jgi:hypothetical protein